MRVNIYAEEITDRVEIISKTINGETFTGVRFYLELPICYSTPGGGHQITHRGPFIHGPGDDDSSAVTFWGKRDLRKVLSKALSILVQHEASRPVEPVSMTQSTSHGKASQAPCRHNNDPTVCPHRTWEEIEDNIPCR